MGAPNDAPSYNDEGFGRLYGCVAGDDMQPVYGREELVSGRMVDYWMLAELEAAPVDPNEAVSDLENVRRLGKAVTMLGFMDEGRYAAVSRIDQDREGELTMRVAHQETEAGRPLNQLATFRVALAAARFEPPIDNPIAQAETFAWMVRIARLITGQEV